MGGHLLDQSAGADEVGATNSTCWGKDTPRVCKGRNRWLSPDCVDSTIYVDDLARCLGKPIRK